MTVFVILIGNAILVEIDPDFFTTREIWETLVMGLAIDVFYTWFFVSKVNKIMGLLKEIKEEGK